ncbi:MAG TPA: hypothetical protein VEU62_24100, partial [Bryobacterales bacterium]|nr:hypothetical protein [Bryobacterales bacterium]
MRLLYLLLIILVAGAAPLGAAGNQTVGVRLLLGLTDHEPAQWDGSVEARGARIAAIEPWRFEVPDEITGHAWRISTHRIRL